MGAGSLKILTGVLVHRVTRPLRGSVSCGSGWSVPCVSIQLRTDRDPFSTYIPALHTGSSVGGEAAGGVVLVTVASSSQPGTSAPGNYLV